MKERLEQVAADLYVPVEVEKEIDAPQARIFKVQPKKRILKSGKKGRLTRFVTLRNRAEDIAATLEVPNIRIVTNGGIYIEVPKETPGIVYREDVDARTSKLTTALGVDMYNQPLTLDIEGAPHLLIAGATGSGKSVAINTMLGDLLGQNTPATLRLVLIDVKRVELARYRDSKFLAMPVVTTVGGANEALGEMLDTVEERYAMMEKKGVQDASALKMTPIVVVVDEFADLILQGSYGLEEKLVRIAQIGRAASVHLVISTQRPSADVVNGLIKANFPTRIAFRTADSTNSRIILDQNGAEALVGQGDGLLLKNGELTRFKGAIRREPVEVEKKKPFKLEVKPSKGKVNIVPLVIAVIALLGIAACLGLSLLGG